LVRKARNPEAKANAWAWRVDQASIPGMGMSDTPTQDP
jgi:hypothetical protein